MKSAERDQPTTTLLIAIGDDKRTEILRGFAAVALVPARQAIADGDDKNQQILPFPTLVESTIPLNGDVNPYGVAFVPNRFPAGGLLNPGDLLIANFNNNQNIQGTGTTIIKVAPNGQTSLFFQGTAPLGLSTGLAVLKAGFVLVADCPNRDRTWASCACLSVLFENAQGHF